MQNYVTYTSLSQVQYENLRKETVTMQDIYWILVNLQKIFTTMRMSQTYLAKVIGTTRQTINKALQKLQKSGLIKITNRGYLRTCIYKILTAKEVSQDIVDFLRNKKTFQSEKSDTIQRVSEFLSDRVPVTKKSRHSRPTKLDYAEAFWNWMHGHIPETLLRPLQSDTPESAIHQPTHFF